jgi:5'-phosphate synthase pdxT subunit
MVTKYNLTIILQIQQYRKNIGVLALQGDFAEHLAAVPNAFEVRTVTDLEKCSGLIIPGGESTTIGKLLKLTGLDLEIKKRFSEGSLKIWGTCAGAILCATNIDSKTPVNQLSLGDYTIARNAYGNQLYSFETELDFTDFSVKVAFIRAPKITSFDSGFEVLSEYNKEPIFIRKGNLLVSTCHPELYENEKFYDWLKKWLMASS